MFYQAVHRVLGKQLGQDAKFSAHSCYFTEDAKLAEFLEVLQRYSGKGRLWRAVEQ